MLSNNNLCIACGKPCKDHQYECDVCADREWKCLTCGAPCPPQRGDCHACAAKVLQEVKDMNLPGVVLLDFPDADKEAKAPKHIQEVLQALRTNLKRHADD